MKLHNYLTIIFLIFLDQLTKHYVMTLQHEIFINNFLNIVFVKNFGITFGILNHVDEFITRVLLSLMCILITICLCVLSKRNGNVYSWMIAGAIGNLIDRVHLGYVVDFLDFHLGLRHWPAFNIADSCICIGAILMLICDDKKGKKNEVN